MVREADLPGGKILVSYAAGREEGGATPMRLVINPTNYPTNRSYNVCQRRYRIFGTVSTQAEESLGSTTLLHGASLSCR